MNNENNKTKYPFLSAYSITMSISWILILVLFLQQGEYDQEEPSPKERPKMDVFMDCYDVSTTSRYEVIDAMLIEFDWSDLPLLGEDLDKGMSKVKEFIRRNAIRIEPHTLVARLEFFTEDGGLIMWDTTVERLQAIGRTDSIKWNRKYR